MTTRWNDLVALAREIEQARRTGATIEPEKARRLARGVLTLDDEALAQLDELERRTRPSRP